MAELPDSPVTREEHLLAKIAGQSAEDVSPVTRTERYLSYIVKHGGGGGGGYATPTGQIITMMGKTAPDGYLACDGTVYNIADYAALAAYFAAQFDASNYFGGDGTTTFAVPDLRGEFLRGAGTNGHENQGSGAAVGAHQDATTVPNISSFNNGNKIGIRHLAVGSGSRISNPDYQLNQTRNITEASSTFIADSSSVFDGSTVSVRPTNTSVLYCIKT